MSVVENELRNLWRIFRRNVDAVVLDISEIKSEKRNLIGSKRHKYMRNE